MLKNISRNHRGRPAINASHDIAEIILDAAERLLQKYDCCDLTTKSIAQEANVDKAMIRYYYGNKDGLILEIINRYSAHMAQQLTALEGLDLESPSITHDMFEILIKTNYSKPWITRLLTSELSRGNSSIKATYLKRVGDKGMTLSILEKLLKKLVEKGVYDSSFDITCMTLSIASIATAPIIVSGFYGGAVDVVKDKREKWIDYLSDLFDHKLRPGTTQEKVPINCH